MEVDPNVIKEVVSVANSEPFKALSLPTTTEIGAFLGSFASVIRFYSDENLKRIFTRWAEQRGRQEVITATEIRKVMPLLQAASMEADDEMQQRWAALMETAARYDDRYLPTFGQTLSLLTSLEARFLHRIRESSPGLGDKEEDEQREFFTEQELNVIFCREPREHLLATGLDYGEAQILHAGRFSIIVSDLIRLGLLEERITSSQTKSAKIGELRVLLYQRPEAGKSTYRMTRFGRQFLSAVTPHPSPEEIMRAANDISPDGLDQEF